VEKVRRGENWKEISEKRILIMLDVKVLNTDSYEEERRKI